MFCSDITFDAIEEREKHLNGWFSSIALLASSEEAQRFYEKLGFTEPKRIECSNDTVVLMQCEHIGLEIFIDPKYPERVTEPEANGLRYIAFLEENLEEVMKLVKGEERRKDLFGEKI